MKKIYTLLSAIIVSVSIFAQAPQKMSYQAAVRDAGNALIKNHSVGMKISVLQGATPVYVETQTTSSNANGLVTVEIGGGTVVSGNFSTINWNSGTYSVKAETDPTGGTNYTISGTSKLLSVPYALNSSDNKWSSNANGINSNAGNVGIGTTLPITQLHVKSALANVATFDGGNSLWVTLAENGINRGYIGSYAGNAEDIDFGTYGGNTTGSVHLTTNDAPKLTVINNGNVGVGTTTPTTTLEVNGATKLGTDAPAIKMKKLSGTTGAAQGAQISIAHGLNSEKILAVNVLVQYATVGYDVPSSYTLNPGYEFTYYVTPTDIWVWVKSGNSASVVSKPIKILITYEE
ncbi:MAG: hypothetical protein Q7U54_15535 [Bacteroidales bacterium]|nr:hypothetical protein [Bacteroidales bacterium]